MGVALTSGFWAIFVFIFTRHLEEFCLTAWETKTALFQTVQSSALPKLYFSFLPGRETGALPDWRDLTSSVQLCWFVFQCHQQIKSPLNRR